MDLSIVVLHYNHWELSKSCLASIDTQGIPCSYEKLLIDNGSSKNWWMDRTVIEKDHVSFSDGFKKAYPSWRCVTYPDNRGHIVGQNRCFQSAQGKWVLFVANDVRLTRECISTLWKERVGSHAILQPLLFDQNGFVDNHGLWWRYPGYGLSERCERYSTECTWSIDAFSGSCYLMDKWVWDYLGGFDERLESSHEDIDFSLRSQRVGGFIKRCYAARAIHVGNATLQHQPSHNREAFHRDRLYVLRKHYHGLDRILRVTLVTMLDFLHRVTRLYAIRL